MTAPMLEISARSGAGLAQLTATMRAMLFGGEVISESPMLANTRQRDAAARAETALGDAILTQAHGGGEELLAVDLMAAASALGQITGDDIREEVIHEIFERFCIGK